MAGPEEIRDLREALSRLLDQAETLSRRIDRLEKGNAVAPVPLPVARQTPSAPPVSVPPPPLPIAPVPIPPPLARPATPKPVFEPKPSLPTQFLSQLRKVSGLGEDAGWELIIGTWLIPRVAVAMLLIAAVFGLTMAMHYWGPPLRILAGYGVCAAFLLAGWRLEKGYAPFAKVLYSGGFALSYFVTFATHYIPYARVFTTAEPALLLMGVMVVAWAGLAQWRRSRTMAVLVVVLGHGTVALSSITLDPPDKMAVAGLLMLAGGGAWFMLKNRWHVPALLSVVGCYLNYLLWLYESPSSDRWADFTMALVVLVLFYLIHALASLFAPTATGQGRGSLWLRNLHVTLNSMGFFLVGTILIQGFAPARDYQDMFRYVFAAGLLTLAMAHLRLRSGDPVHNAYFTKAVLVASLGLSASYDGAALPAALAIQALVLIWSSRLSSLPVTRLLATLVAVAALVEGLTIAYDPAYPTYQDQTYRETLTQVMLLVGALWGCAVLHEHTDWRLRGIRLPWADEGLHHLLQPLDLLQDEEGTTPPSHAHLPAGYALAGTLAAVAWSGQLFTREHTPAALAGCALVLGLAAYGFRTRSLGLASIALVVVSAAKGLNGYSGDSQWAPLVGAAVSAALLALLSEPFGGDRSRGVTYLRHPVSVHALYISAGLLSAMTCYWLLEPFLDTFLLTILAGAMLGLCLYLQGKPVSLAATILFGYAVFAWMEEGPNIREFEGPEWTLHVTALLLIATGLAGDYGTRLLRAMGRAWHVGWLWVAMSLVLALVYVINLSDTYFDEYNIACVTLICIGYMLYGVWAHFSRTALTLSLLVAIILTFLMFSGHAFGMPYQHRPDLTLVVNFGLMAGYWVLIERAVTLADIDHKAARILRVVSVTFATTLLAVMMSRMPLLEEYYLTIGWAVLAFALFGGSLALRERLYRIAGLILFALTIGRAALIDTRQLDGFYRVGAFAVLGLLLLIIGYGYFQSVALMRRKRTPDQV